jgi:hypothetical protein
MTPPPAHSPLPRHWRAHKDEILRRWNLHDKLVKALDDVLNQFLIDPDGHAKGCSEKVCAARHAVALLREARRGDGK